MQPTEQAASEPDSQLPTIHEEAMKMSKTVLRMENDENTRDKRLKLKRERFHLDVRKNLFHPEGNYILEEFAQRSCIVCILGDL